MAQYVNLPNYTPSLGESLRNRYDDGVGKGWNALGAALMGGGGQRSDPEFYAKNYMLGQRARINDATIGEKLAAGRVQTAEAVKREAENIARVQNRQNMINNGVDPSVAGIIDGNFAAGYNPNIAYEAMRNQLKLNADRDAYDAMKNGNVEAGNRSLAVSSGHPLAVTHVADNVAFNPYAPSAGQPFTPTSIGEAMTTEKNAQAAAANALAAKRGMGAGMPSGLPPGVFQDDTGTHGKLPDGTIVNFDNTMPKDAVNAALSGMLVDHPILKPQPLPAAELKALFPDESTRMQFLSETANKAETNKNYLNGPYAAQKYAQAHQFDDVRSDMTLRQPEQPGLLSRIFSGATGTSATNASVDPANQVSGDDAVTVTDKSAYDALPSGALWRDTQGNLRRKR